MQLDLSNVKQFRLTCKAMADLLLHQIFRTLNLNISRTNMENGVKKIEALSGGHAAGLAARELSIWSLAPAYDPAHPRSSTYDNELRKWVSNPLPEAPSDVAIAEERLVNHLFNAISSMRGLYRVK